MAVRQSLAGATTSPERGLGRPLWIVVAIFKSRHPGGMITTEIHPLDMATMGRDNSLGTIVATMDSSVIARPIKIVQLIQIIEIRIKIETSFKIILITTIDHTITTVCLSPTSTSKMIRDIIPGEIRTMRDSTRIPHTVPNIMISKEKRIVPRAPSIRNISNFRFVCRSKPPLCKARA